ncbi:T9SS type A sorting domain-containing protein [Dokdonia sinensis]|nr:T9SS type A sorting domain-containing protein [Dokdonia sinensis]
MIKKTLLTLTFCAVAGSAFAQIGTDAPWMESFAENPRAAKFQDIQEAFYAYWADKDETVKGSGYKPFKRWESINQNFLNPDGTLMTSQQQLQGWRDKVSMRINREDSGDWQSVGPLSHLETGSWSPGQGRVNAMAVDPNNDDILYVGAPNGGLWKSTDAGTNWEPLTDDLPQIGVSAIMVDPNDSNIIYIGTGDDDAGDSDGVGVLKSLDGGETWDFTGLNETNSPLSFNEIFIHPTDSNILWTSSSSGVYKTTNGGDDWTLVRSGNIRDMRVQPGNPDILYCVSSNRFYKSVDGGDTWSLRTDGTPNGAVNRLTIDVTPANPDVVYIFAANGNNQFKGIYKSTDAGETFTLTSNGDPGVFDGSSQSWYDFAFAVSDTDENIIFTGVLNVWRSTNSGASFVRINNWSSPEQPSYTHADIHNLRYINGKLYCGSDGGIYVSENNGVVFTDLTENLAIGQFYRIDVAKDDSQIIAGGLQDNGGYGRSNNQWHNFYGADGMNVVIDPQDSNKMTGLIQGGGGPYITEDGGASLATNGFPNGPDSGDWITPLGYSKDGRVIGAYRSIWEFNPVTLSWSRLSSTVAAGGTVKHMALDPSDDDIMYVAYSNTLRQSVNGGTSFTTLATSFSSDITWVDVDGEDNRILYVTTRGANGRVFKITLDDDDISEVDDIDDITGSLPNIPKLVIKNQNNHSDNPLFLGTSIGVWRYDDVTEDWTPFDNGLPNVTVRDLEINYTDGNITAGTYGRGIWQSAIPQEALSVDSFSSNSLRIFPNPSNGIFNLQWRSAGNSLVTEINVYDITGKRVLSSKVTDGSLSSAVDLSSVSAGIYLLKMQIEGVEVTKKLVVR